jgi:hypothetical protein
MNLGELFTSLSYGVLSNLAVGGEGSGTIPASHQTRLVSFVNAGLRDLHERLLLKIDDMIIRATDGRTNYPLKVEYADTDPTVGPKFITDTLAYPFKGNLIRILEIYDEHGGEIVLNDSGNENSFFMPEPDILQIPYPVTGNDYFVIYQADHATLQDGDLTQLIDIPNSLLTALEAYVAYRVMAPMNGQEQAAKGMEHFRRYEILIESVEERDLAQTSIIRTTTKLEDRGFV